MAKPVIWTVDGDPDVLRAVERDLRQSRPRHRDGFGRFDPGGGRLVVVVTGPAGLAATLYGAADGLRTLLAASRLCSGYARPRPGLDTIWPTTDGPGRNSGILLLEARAGRLAGIPVSGAVIGADHCLSEIAPEMTRCGALVVLFRECFRRRRAGEHPLRAQMFAETRAHASPFSLSNVRRMRACAKGTL